MPKRLSVGRIMRNSSIADERGAMLLIMAASIFFMAFLFAGLAEFGRYLITKEQTQTAADAAVLASSYAGVKRKVQVEVITDIGSRRECCGYDDEGNCDPCCLKCPLVIRTRTGYESDLLDRGGWRRYCATEPCDTKCIDDGIRCWHEVKRRWVEYVPSQSMDAAQLLLTMNMPDQANDIWLSREAIIYDNPDSIYYPSVVIYVKSKMRSLFPGLSRVFPKSYETETCSQGETYFRDPKTKDKKWIRPPEDACWVN